MREQNEIILLSGIGLVAEAKSGLDYRSQRVLSAALQSNVTSLRSHQYCRSSLISCAGPREEPLTTA